MKTHRIPSLLLPSVRRLLARIVPLLVAVLLSFMAVSVVRADDTPGADGYVPRSGPSSLASGYSNGGYEWSEGGDYYQLDTSGQIQLSSTKDIFWKSDNHTIVFTIYADSVGNGTISGSETGVVVQGRLYFNAGGVLYGPNSYDLFGSAYTIQSAIYSTYPDQDGSSHLALTEYYEGANTGSLSVDYAQEASFSGHDPVVGDFSGHHLGGYTLIFDLNRTAPSFAPRQLWVNSTLVSWQPGPITNTEGDITDHYAGTDADGNAITLAVSGNIPNFAKTVGASNPSVVVEVRNGGNELLSRGTGTYVKGSPSYFSMSGWYIGVAQYSRTTPLYLPTHPNLWVNGTRYAFRGGIDDGAGNSVDTYSNASVGTLTLSGNSSSSATALVSYNGTNFSGIFSATVNEVSGVAISVSPPGADAFWVNGSLYRRTADDDYAYANPAGQSLGVSYAGGNVQLSGADAVSPFSGSFTDGSRGIFICSRSTGALLPACPAMADGSLQLDTTNAPADLPPANKVAGDIWPFLGTAAEDGNPSTQAAYYGNAATGGPGSLLLKIRASGDAVRTVTLTDYAGQTSSVGTYDTTTHLFQTTLGQLPTRLYGTTGYAEGNNMRWLWLQPANGRPSTVLVAGEVWGFTGSDGNGDHYAGYYSGQQLSFDATSGRDGFGSVTLNDPLHPNTADPGGAFTGTYYNNGFQMSGGSPVVTSGDKEGAVIAAGLSLSTTGADLDVLGNLFSLGSLKSDANKVGLTLQFSDDTATATARLTSALSRPLAEWLWSHAASGSPATGVPMMKLDSGNRLTLFDPTDATKAAIILNPAGRSRFDKPIRIEPQGDLDMGEFKHGPGEPR